MATSIKYFIGLVLFVNIYLNFSANIIKAVEFTNPVTNTAEADCTTNLKAERFAGEVSLEDRVKLCRSMNRIALKLNSTTWSPELATELNNIWKVFSLEPVTIKLMPKDYSSKILAMAEAFPEGDTKGKFEATVYIRPEKSDSDEFFQVLFHELRHVYDFNDTWKNKTELNSIELERRAFLLMSKITQETPEKEHFSDVPNFWKDSWKNLSAKEISSKRESAVEKYLQDNKIYRTLKTNNQTLDFRYLQNLSQKGNSNSSKTISKTDGERLPERPDAPRTSGMIPQNIHEVDFSLDKPKNPRDEKEILRIALSNEKKIYYGMTNFVYDQKLQLQCWKKGKTVENFIENNLITRDEKGNALSKSNIALLSTSLPSCIPNYQDLKTDFTETFWASPALEKMPIRFAGFVEVEGKTLARYSVLRPSKELYDQLANEYGAVRPFRVFVGTIFVSPEDGQIIKFWGTSFPEENVTNNNSQKIVGSYSVTALRQRLNINDGVWITVHIGTVAVANIGNNSKPFSYTVKFENYRQGTSNMRILDDTVAMATN